MTKEKQFLTSVADVLIFDDESGALIANGKTLLNSSMSQAVQNQTINAGKGSQKVFEIAYQKEINFTIEDAAFSEFYICLQNNASINRILGDYYTSEYVKLNASGKGTLKETPVGRVQVEQENGAYVSVNVVGKEITYTALANKEIQVVYATKKMMDTIEISADAFPRAVRMVLNANLYTSNGKNQEMQITVPKFKPNGSLELSMTHDGVSSSSLEGTALVDNKGNYAYIAFNDINGSNVELIGLAANPSDVLLDNAISNDSVAVTVYGIRGGNHANIIMDNTELTFTSDDPAVATVDANGVIQIAASAVDGAKTTVKVTDGTFTDIIKVEIV